MHTVWRKGMGLYRNQVPPELKDIRTQHGFFSFPCFLLLR